MRGFLVQREMGRLRVAAVRVQTARRCYSRWAAFGTLRAAVVKCQAGARMLMARGVRWRIQRAAAIVHRFMRWQRTAVRELSVE